MENRQTEPNIKFLNQKCGLCNGFGTLKYGTIPCKPCRGLGIVVVDQETGLVVTQEVKNE